MPDSEKERQHKIELGLKFFANAKIDNDLYEDALEQLLIAESMYKQDYFVLYRIGLIYLYAPNLLNVEKAIEYFTRSAKYSIIETDKKASTLFNILNKKFVQNNIDEKEYITYKFTIVSENINLSRRHLIRFIYYLEQGSKSIISIDKDYNSSIITIVVQFDGEPNFDFLKRNFEFSNDFIKYLKLDNSFSLEESIKIITSESYDKIAFSYYLLGDFIKAVSFQESCVQLDNKLINRFNLAKYQIRNNQIEQAINGIKIVLDSEIEYLLLFYSDFDFMSCEEVVKYLDSIESILNDNFIRVYVNN